MYPPDACPVGPAVDRTMCPNLISRVAAVYGSGFRLHEVLTHSRISPGRPTRYYGQHHDSWGMFGVDEGERFRPTCHRSEHDTISPRRLNWTGWMRVFNKEVVLFYRWIQSDMAWKFLQHHQVSSCVTAPDVRAAIKTYKSNVDGQLYFFTFSQWWKTIIMKQTERLWLKRFNLGIITRADAAKLLTEISAH